MNRWLFCILVIMVVSQSVDCKKRRKSSKLKNCKGKYICNSNGGTSCKCIERSKICNGFNDCPDYDDEHGCPCPPLPNPINGHVDLTEGTKLNAKAKFSCNTGYIRMGDSSRTCQANRAWSGASPTCQKGGCDCDNKQAVDEIPMPVNGGGHVLTSQQFRDIMELNDAQATAIGSIIPEDAVVDVYDNQGIATDTSIISDEQSKAINVIISELCPSTVIVDGVDNNNNNNLDSFDNNYNNNLYGVDNNNNNNLDSFDNNYNNNLDGVDNNNNNNLSCSICNKSFTLKGNLKRHLQSHITNEEFKCKNCGRSYRRKDNCSRHEADCGGKARTICYVCGCVFAISSNLKRHIKNTHDQENNTIYCTFCNQSFSNKWNMKRHIRQKHTESKPECDKCHKKFARIKEHVKICCNLRLSVHECDICCKKFKEKRYLTEHKKYKHSVKRYQCTRCGDFFAHRNSRIEHEKYCTK